MSSSLFQPTQQSLTPQQNDFGSYANNMRNAIRAQGEQQFLQAYMQQNPGFQNFLRQNMGKPIEQVAREMNIDFSAVSPHLKY